MRCEVGVWLTEKVELEKEAAACSLFVPNPV